MDAIFVTTRKPIKKMIYFTQSTCIVFRTYPKQLLSLIRQDCQNTVSSVSSCIVRLYINIRHCVFSNGFNISDLK